MDAYFKLLESCLGRDKILRLCSFAALAGAGNLKGESARRLGTIAAQIGETRTVLRLFDGLPMLKSVLRLGFNTRETNQLTRFLTVLSTWSIQLFFPFEALAWAGRHRLLPVTNIERWSGLSVATWAIFLLCNIMKSLLKLPGIQRTKLKLQKQKMHDPLEGRSPEKEQNDVVDWSIKQLQYEEMSEYLSLVQHVSDFINAVNWLPKGYFWSGKLSLAQSGVMGLMSTLVMLYSTFRQPPKQ